MAIELTSKQKEVYKMNTNTTIIKMNKTFKTGNNEFTNDKALDRKLSAKSHKQAIKKARFNKNIARTL